MKKEYEVPILEEEKVIVEDIIATSSVDGYDEKAGDFNNQWLW